MHHPFAGIIPHSTVAVVDDDHRLAEPASTRRGFFVKLLSLSTGLGLLFAGRHSNAQEVRAGGGGSGAGSSGQPNVPAFRGGGRVTTQALGEEGGGATTFALGEEGGAYPPPQYPGYPTTYALGEEGGGYPPSRNPGNVTTYALGEEGSYPPYFRRYYPRRRR